MEMENQTPVGIIGGVGPYAGLDFIRKIFNNTQALKDQEHLDCMLVSCPSIIPDRTEFLLNGKAEEENPAFGIFESARRLYQAGVRHAAIACNTAHADRIFSPLCAMVTESLPGFNIVNMLETCAAYAKKTLRHITRIGLLSTKGTYQSRVYHEYFREADGYTLVEPETTGKEKIHDAIYNKIFGIKAYSQPVKPQAKNHIIYEIFRLIDHGAEAVILGCTELPLAVDIGDFPVPILDPALLTARRLIALAAPEKLTANAV
jgi:aspartate racemase